MMISVEKRLMITANILKCLGGLKDYFHSFLPINDNTAKLISKDRLNNLRISLILQGRNLLSDKELVKSQGISYFLISTKKLIGPSATFIELWANMVYYIESADSIGMPYKPKLVSEGRFALK